MADTTRLNELAGQLNEALGEVTPYKLAIAPPGEILPAEKNAHYMPKRVYDQLIANVRRDKNLSSLPLCWRRPDGSFVALSGNHRTKVAAEAGVPLILFLYTDQDLSRSEQIGIQLSHNALVGQDNPTTLIELWQEIGHLDMKVYSGLDEDMLKTIDPANVTRINNQALQLEELRLYFLSPEVDRIQEVLKRIGTANRRRLGAAYADFDRFFETLLTFKEASNIVNTSTAIMAMIEIVEEWLGRHADGSDSASTAE